MRFELLYNEYYDKVLKYIAGHTDSVQEAEDLASEVFVKCYDNFESYDSSKASVKTWIYAITKNCLKNYYRGKKNNLSLDDSDNGIAEPADKTDMESAVELTEMRKVLADALMTLDERNRRVVVLKYFSEKPSKEIARIMGLSDENVRVMLNRSLKKMRDHLGKNNIRWEF